MECVNMRFVEVADMRNSGYTVPQWLLQPVPDQDMEKVKCSDSKEHFQSDTKPFQSDVDSDDTFIAGEVFYFQNVEAPRCEEALKPNLSKWLLETSPDLDADMRIKNHTCEKPLEPDLSKWLLKTSPNSEADVRKAEDSGFNKPGISCICLDKFDFKGLLKPGSSAFLKSASELGEVFSSHLDRSGFKGFSQV